MSETITKPVIQFWRVNGRDIADTAEWLFPRIQAVFPRVSVIGVNSYLQAATQTGEMFFIRTKRAILLAAIVPGIMGASPTVAVHFAFGDTPPAGEGEETDSETEGVIGEEIGELYFRVRQWALRLDAAAVEISPHTDCDRSFIRERIGKLTRSERHVLNLMEGA